MKKMIIVVSILSVSFVFSENQKYPNGIYSKNYKKIKMKEESISAGRKIVSTGHSPSARYNSRESSFIATKVDSSLNGYGAYNSDPNPLAFVPDEGYVAVYRQFQGFDVTAGYIGAAQSEDGEEWFTEQKLNECYPGGQLCEPSLPTATGTPQGRYPSAGFAEDGQPTAIWNEYTNADYGGGTYGGFPLYAYDSDEIGEFSTWNTPFTLNNGCQTTPCDPADLWVGNSRVINGPSGAKLVAQYNSWADDTKELMITSSFYTNGYFLMNDPYISFDQLEDDPENPGTGLWYPGGYQSSPDWSINEDGVGYLATMGWWNGGIDDIESPTSQSLYIKKTEDYGETWTNDEGFHNSGWYEWSDELQVTIMDSLLTAWSDTAHPYYDEVYHYGDTLAYDMELDDNGDSVEVYFYPTPAWLPFYTFDLATDEDGGLHVIFPTLLYGCKDVNGGCDDSDGDLFADSLYYWTDIPGVGMIYMYNPDPTDDPSNWSATHISDLSNTYGADFFNSPIFHIYADGASDYWGSMQYFYPQLSTGPDGTLWFASSAVSDLDTSTYYPTDIDIFMRKSADNGLTWSEEENVTNTPMEVATGGIVTYYLENGMHLAQQGTEEEIGVFFQMADFENETYPPATGYEDYLNRVYVGIYSNDFGSDVTVSTGGEFHVPGSFNLRQNYPNPFNPKTHIDYDLNVAGQVVLDLYDLRGKLVETFINEEKPVGAHQFVLDGSQLASGVYFYTMTANGISRTRKLVLMK
ncbi:MAG: T9SS type A sorting domain-containing protein [Candidatus Neomarinimicrobiota bacterium]|nr:T9SS type A sorting domain-containing protein [Candidatus Neomarinimicrobiota bacterium]